MNGIKIQLFSPKKREFLPYLLIISNFTPVYLTFILVPLVFPYFIVSLLSPYLYPICSKKSFIFFRSYFGLRKILKFSLFVSLENDTVSSSSSSLRSLLFSLHVFASSNKWKNSQLTTSYSTYLVGFIQTSLLTRQPKPVETK